MNNITIITINTKDKFLVENIGSSIHEILSPFKIWNFCIANKEFELATILETKFNSSNIGIYIPDTIKYSKTSYYKHYKGSLLNHTNTIHKFKKCFMLDDAHLYFYDVDLCDEFNYLNSKFPLWQFGSGENRLEVCLGPVDKDPNYMYDINCADVNNSILLPIPVIGEANRIENNWNEIYTPSFNAIPRSLKKLYRLKSRIEITTSSRKRNKTNAYKKIQKEIGFKSLRAAKEDKNIPYGWFGDSEIFKKEVIKIYNNTQLRVVDLLLDYYNEGKRAYDFPINDVEKLRELIKNKMNKSFDLNCDVIINHIDEIKHEKIKNISVKLATIRFTIINIPNDVVEIKNQLGRMKSYGCGALFVY